MSMSAIESSIIAGEFAVEKLLYALWDDDGDEDEDGGVIY